MVLRFPLNVIAQVAVASLVSATPIDEKADSTKTLLLISNQLVEIAKHQTSNYPEGKVAQQVNALIEQVSGCEDLVRLALICNGIAGNQRAEHARYDGVFDFAMWHCARQISLRPGGEAEFSLSYLKSVIGQDGGGALTTGELIAAQRKLTKESKQ